MFSGEFSEIFKNNFFTEYLRTSAFNKLFSRPPVNRCIFELYQDLNSIRIYMFQMLADAYLGRS